MLAAALASGIVPMAASGAPPDFVTPPTRSLALGGRGPAVFPDPIDPSDRVDFAVVVTRGDSGAEFLAPGERIVSFDLSPSAAARAAGLTIRRDDAYRVVLTDDRITFWVDIADDAEAAQTFDGVGRDLGIELTVDTSSTPPRRRQRTLIVKVANQ